VRYNELERIRKGKNLTQKQFAELIGISESTYKKNIANKNMTINVLERACKILKVSVSIFFEEQKDETKGMSLNEQSIKYGSDAPLNQLIEDLRTQLKVKDEQISFLQHLIENKE